MSKIQIARNYIHKKPIPWNNYVRYLVKRQHMK